MLYPTWQESLAYLRELRNVPAAQASARVLEQARTRWEHDVIARTSMHDLLFTLPNDDDYPFVASVRVESADDAYVLFLWDHDRLVQKLTTNRDNIEATLDTFLERLTSLR